MKLYPTRQRLLGIKTVGPAQLVYVDTPGFQLGYKKALNRYMNRTISNTVNDVDLILFMTDRLRFSEDDDKLLDGLRKLECPVFLVINKVDRPDALSQALVEAKIGIRSINPGKTSLEQVFAALTASGSGYSFSVTSVITPSVPSLPTKSRVRS